MRFAWTSCQALQHTPACVIQTSCDFLGGSEGRQTTTFLVTFVPKIPLNELCPPMILWPLSCWHMPHSKTQPFSFESPNKSRLNKDCGCLLTSLSFGASPEGLPRTSAIVYRLLKALGLFSVPPHPHCPWSPKSLFLPLFNMLQDVVAHLALGLPLRGTVDLAGTSHALPFSLPLCPC